MTLDEMWRKKMEAMKASERTTTTKGSLGKSREIGRRQGRQSRFVQLASVPDSAAGRALKSNARPADSL
jgi:hypothetical protein